MISAGLYQKKPVIISAIKLTPENIGQAEEWCGGQIKGTKLPVEERCIDIQTLEGEMRASMGDWIIRGIKGEYYPLQARIFEMSYQAVR